MKKKFKKSSFSLDNVIAKSNFNYCKNLKWFLIAPLAIILVGIILLSTLGFNLGLDFTGGSTFTIYSNVGGEIKNGLGENITQYDLSKTEDYDAMKGLITEVLRDEGIAGNISFQTTKIDIVDYNVSDGWAIIIKFQNKSAEGDAVTSENTQINNALLARFDIGSDFSKAVQNGGTITGSASSELLMKAFLAMLVAIILILIYVAFRFEFTSGLAAILALMHDLLVTASLVLMFRITVNSSFIAALVTILGYSINNTIVIFDRMRENRKSGRFDKASNEVLANASVRETMSRSIYTTLTTLVTILLVAIIGVSDIRDFALPIVFGIGAGFYSSVFITPGLWAIAYKPKKKKQENN